MALKPSVILTGCSGGIGGHLAFRLIEEGWHVIGLDNREPLNTPRSDFDFIKCDLAMLADNDAAGKALFEQFHSLPAFEQLRGLINNAAIQIVAPIHEIDLADFRKSLDINLVAAFQLSKICFDGLSTNAGAIVNMSSIHAQLSKKHFVAYAVSKAALSALTKGLAIEWGDKVRVNAIEPAAIETEMLMAGFGDSWQEDRVALAHSHPSKTLGQLDDIFSVVRLLLEGPAFLNGSLIDVSGGIRGVLHDPKSE